MSDKSKICAIGEKKLIDGNWYEKGEALAGCIGCDFVNSAFLGTICKRPDGAVYASIEDGGSECHRSVWINCDPPTAHEIKLESEAPPVEECAGCRWWDRIHTTEEGVCCFLPPSLIHVPSKTYETTHGYTRTDAARVDQVRPRTEANERCGWRVRA